MGLEKFEINLFMLLLHKKYDQLWMVSDLRSEILVDIFRLQRQKYESEEDTTIYIDDIREQFDPYWLQEGQTYSDGNNFSHLRVWSIPLDFENHRFLEVKNDRGIVMKVHETYLSKLRLCDEI